MNVGSAAICVEHMLLPKSGLHGRIYGVSRIRDCSPDSHMIIQLRHDMSHIQSNLHPETAFSTHYVPAGDYFLGEIKQGQTFRIVDLKGNQAADVLFYNAKDPSERYSAMDTIRNQGNLYLSAGTKLMSNANREVLEIVADTCRRHDSP